MTWNIALPGWSLVHVPMFIHVVKTVDFIISIVNGFRRWIVTPLVNVILTPPNPTPPQSTSQLTLDLHSPFNASYATLARHIKFKVPAPVMKRLHGHRSFAAANR